MVIPMTGRTSMTERPGDTGLHKTEVAGRLYGIHEENSAWTDSIMQVHVFNLDMLKNGSNFARLFNNAH